MASVSFEKGLQDHLASKTKLTAKEKRVQRILDLPADSQRRQRVLERMEDTARGHLGAVGKIDWGSIDWDKLLAFIMKILALFGV